MRDAGKSLTLFLSNGKSLLWWHRQGILSREILLYLRFLRLGMFDEIKIFSYDAADRGFVRSLVEQEPLFDRIRILAPRKWRFQRAIGLFWGLVGPFRFRSEIAGSVAIKTNQINGSWAAILATLLTGRPLVLRMGYLLSQNYGRSGQRTKAFLARIVERLGFRGARYVLVSSQETAQRLDGRAGLREKLVLTPTYVDISSFQPKEEYRFDEAIIAVGRFTKAKNFENLLRGCALAKRDLVLVGSGEMEAELRSIAGRLPLRVTFAGRIENDRLAAILRQHTVYAIPSLYEGLPKSLLEAMACGLICVGSRVPGISQLIEDGVSGYLIDGFDPDAISASIQRAFLDRDAEIGFRARRTVEQASSLETYVAREARLYANIEASAA